MSRSFILVASIGISLSWAAMAAADGDYAALGENVLADAVNVGSGEQTNVDDWEAMESVNVNGNQLTGGGENSNAGDRESGDVVILMGEDAEIGNYALDASVSNNSVSVAGSGSSADSESEFSSHSGFSSSYGVTAASLNAGASASQSVNVNVTSSVSM